MREKKKRGRGWGWGREGARAIQIQAYEKHWSKWRCPRQYLQSGRNEQYSLKAVFRSEKLLLRKYCSRRLPSTTPQSARQCRHKVPDNADTKCQTMPTQSARQCRHKDQLLTALRIFDPLTETEFVYSLCSFHFCDKKLTDEIKVLEHNT